MKYFFLLAVLLPNIANSQIITTIAGTGSSSSTGDGGPATAAGISDPCYGTFDKMGNFYFSDISANRIRKISTEGIITTIAGNGSGAFYGDGMPATNASINAPVGIKFDTAGNLYIVDHSNFRIRKVDANTNIITTIAGNGSSTYTADNVAATSTGLGDPQCIAIDRFGNIYEAEAFSYRIRKINVAGIITTFAGNGTLGFSGDGGPATAAQIDLPEGLTVDEVGNLYMADPGTLVSRVRKVSTSGIITTIAGNGDYTYANDNMPATATAIAPFDITVNELNDLFIADQYNNRVYKVDHSTGILYNIAGTETAGDTGDGGSATAATLYNPNGIAIDACGSLCIPTQGRISVPGSGRRIRKVTYNPTCTYATVNINSVVQSKFDIYLHPNPATNQIQIDNIPKPTNYQLLSLVGSMILKGTLRVGNNTLSLNTLPTGMYLLEMIDEDGNKTVKKIIKQ